MLSIFMLAIFFLGSHALDDLHAEHEERPPARISEILAQSKTCATNGNSCISDADDDVSDFLQTRVKANVELELGDEQDPANDQKTNNEQEHPDESKSNDEQLAVKELRQVFDQLDYDGSGELEVEELYQQLVENGAPHESQNETHDPYAGQARGFLKSLIQERDLDGSGTLSFSEFLAEQLKDATSDAQSSSAANNMSLVDDVLEMHTNQEKLPTQDEINSLVQEVGEDNSGIQVSRRRKQKNKKQKEWAAKQMLKTEQEICERRTYFIAAGRPRSTRAMSISCSWSGCSAGCRGWDQIGPICHKPCREQYGSTWHGVGPLCFEGCRSGYINGRIHECHERCGDDYSLPQVPIECHGWMYCADSWGTCNEKALKIIVAFAEMAANLFPVAKAGVRAAKAAKGASRLAKLRAALRKMALKLLKKAKKKLVKYMRKQLKEQRKEISQQTMDAIVEGGAELVAAGVIKQQEPSLGQQVLEVADAVDPTGVSSVVASFSASSCGDSQISEMPADGLEEEGALYVDPPVPIWIPFSDMSASQSSAASGGGASKCLTNNVRTSWPGSCTHTHNDYKAWWKVNLRSPVDVKKVVLTSRARCCADRLQNADLYVGGHRCAGVSVPGGGTSEIPCVATGSEVKVQHKHRNYLTICGFKLLAR